MLYLRIDYGSKYASKSHAHLAAGYLADAVLAVVPSGMPNVLMEGLRLMGNSAKSFIAHGQAELIASVVDKMGLISTRCLAREDHWPATLTGMEQVRDLIIVALQAKSNHAGQVFRQLSKAAELVAKTMLQLPGAQAPFTQNYFLAPFYSTADQQSFPVLLTKLANAVLAATGSEKDAPRTVLRNIATWSEELHSDIKGLLLLTIERRSSFTFDIVHWIAHVSKVLLALSIAPACDEYLSGELRKNALDLAATLSWIPTDRDTVRFVETYQITELLFQNVLDAREYGDEEAESDYQRALSEWGFEAGRHQVGWAILERSLCGLAALAILNEDKAGPVLLKDDIKNRLAPERFDHDILERTAREIRKKAGSLERSHFISRIEAVMARLDRRELNQLLNEIADLMTERASIPR